MGGGLFGGAGFTAVGMRDAGFTVGHLLLALKHESFDTMSLRAAGHSARELHAAGVDLATLARAGFFEDVGLNAAGMKDLGFTLRELPEAVKCQGFDVSSLKTSGYTPKDLHATGIDMSSL